MPVGKRFDLRRERRLLNAMLGPIANQTPPSLAKHRRITARIRSEHPNVALLKERLRCRTRKQGLQLMVRSDGDQPPGLIEIPGAGVGAAGSNGGHEGPRVAAQIVAARIGGHLRVEDVDVQGRRTWIRLHEKGGKVHEMPCHYILNEDLHAYIEGAQLTD